MIKHKKKKINPKFNLKKIKLILSDIDGVLTDGGMYFSKTGEAMKKFNTKDGMGMELLHNLKINTILITKENSPISKSRAKKLKVQIYSNIKNKKLILFQICKKSKLTPEEIAYIGDDVNDLEIMKLVGFSAAPADSSVEIIKIADFVCQKNGGDGVFREIANLIINS
jgi:YrbI family 3-deoxy-D-manno-octulosonate 8-phosphate phosphatase